MLNASSKGEKGETSKQPLLVYKDAEDEDEEMVSDKASEEEDDDDEGDEEILEVDVRKRRR